MEGVERPGQSDRMRGATPSQQSLDNKREKIHHLCRVLLNPEGPPKSPANKDSQEEIWEEHSGYELSKMSP